MMRDAPASQSRFRIGIIGTGEIVQSVHLPTLLATDSADVRWLLDSNSARAREVAHAFEIPESAGVDALKSLPPVDVILLALPYGARSRYYAFCAERNIAVYVEKPFARTRAEHESISAQFEPYALCVGLQRRSWSPTVDLKRIVDTEMFGRLRSIKYGFGAPGIVTAGRYASDIRMAGGGVIMEVGVHGLDALLHVCGASSTEVNTCRMVLDDGFDLHVEASVSVEHGGRLVPAVLKMSYLEETIEGIEFTFDAASVRYSWSSGEGLAVTARDGSSFRLGGSRSLEAAKPFPTFYRHWMSFFDALQTRRSNYTSAVQTFTTTSLIEDLYRMGNAPI